MQSNSATYNLIEGKSVFRISLIVIPLVILGVFFWGLGQHNTFFENSIISTTILSIAFFFFITIGLYNGVKLKDNSKKMPETNDSRSVEAVDFGTQFTPTANSFDLDLDLDEGIAGVLIGILLWILYAIFIAVVLWLFSAVIPLVIGAFSAMLYWIFFRALRLVFKNSNKSKGDIMESVRYGLTYTFLYNFWIYGIFILTEYLKLL